MGQIDRYLGRYVYQGLDTDGQSILFSSITIELFDVSCALMVRYAGTMQSLFVQAYRSDIGLNRVRL